MSSRQRPPSVKIRKLVTGGWVAVLHVPTHPADKYYGDWRYSGPDATDVSSRACNALHRVLVRRAMYHERKRHPEMMPTEAKLNQPVAV